MAEQRPERRAGLQLVLEDRHVSLKHPCSLGLAVSLIHPLIPARKNRPSRVNFEPLTRVRSTHNDELCILRAQCLWIPIAPRRLRRSIERDTGNSKGRASRRQDGKIMFLQVRSQSRNPLGRSIDRESQNEQSLTLKQSIQITLKLPLFVYRHPRFICHYRRFASAIPSKGSVPSTYHPSS